MSPSIENLMAVVQKYYDSSTRFHYTTELSPESARRHELWAKWISDMSSWYALRDNLNHELPGYVTGETYPSSDGGPRCMVYPPKELRPPDSSWAVVGCVSLLAPVYSVYGVEYDSMNGRRLNPRARFGLLPPPMDFPAQAVARTIEKTLGYSALPRALAETPVPLFAGALEPPETTLFHVLFTNDPSNIP